MKYFAVLVATIATVSLSSAQDSPQAEVDKSVIDSLFGEHPTIASFTDALSFAEQAGVGNQTLLEAETKYYLFENTDMASIRKLVKKLDTLAPDFDPEQSKLYQSKSAFMAMSQYAKAIIAYESGNTDALKKHITEAIWLYPENAKNFASLIVSHNMVKARKSEQKKD